MKKLILIAFFAISALSSFSQNEIRKGHPQAKADSIEVLAGYDFMVLGWEPGDMLAERIANLAWIIANICEFEEQVTLLQHKNRYINLYAFMGMCENHFELISADHKKITKSKQPLIMYSPEGNVQYKTIGDMANEIYLLSKEEHTQEAIYRPKLEVAIKSFILKYAINPSSYLPISFKWFFNGETYLSIQQTYLIKSSLGITDTVKHFFVTNSNYEIQEISEEHTGTMLSTPAKIDSWLTLYGKTLSKNDSVELNLKLRKLN